MLSHAFNAAIDSCVRLEFLIAVTMKIIVLFCVVWYMLTDISEELPASIFRVQDQVLDLFLGSEDGESIFPRNISKHLPD
jgi:hypothetical protein